MQSVLVTNIKAEMCKEHNLAIYFEKRKLSGGGNLHAVKVIAEGQAIVIFLEAKGEFVVCCAVCMTQCGSCMCACVLFIYLL